MKDNIIIREVHIDDIDLLLQWREEVLRCVFSIPADADTTDLVQSNREYYQRALANGSHVACLAEENGVTIGCGGLCLYDEMPSPDNPTGHCAYLMNIYVHPDHQGHGTGKCIVRWLVGVALSKGIKKIYLETSESGRMLYRGLGFSDMKDMMHLSF
ncbi:MAG: GNAT family N-acetyltransferase [Bacteroidales bacterium]|nr:GNAT family N-acetyltransferase [Bacteroidales bacterium]